MPLNWKRWRDLTVLSDKVVFCFLEIQQGVGKCFSHNSVRALVSFFCVSFFLSQARNCIAIFAFLFFHSNLLPSPTIPPLKMFLMFTLLVYFPGISIIHVFISSCPRRSPCLKPFPPRFILIFKTLLLSLPFPDGPATRAPLSGFKYFYLPVQICILLSPVSVFSWLNSSLPTKNHEHS